MNIDADLLCRVADSIETGNELMGSRWQNSEAEVIACQTISACCVNCRRHGEALSWYGDGLLDVSGAGNVNNPGGLRRLIDDECIVIESYEGSLEAPGDVVCDKGGKPLVLRVTQQLLEYVAKFCAVGQ